MPSEAAGGLKIVVKAVPRLFINLIFVLETKFNPNQLYGVRYGHVLASVALCTGL